MSTKRSILIGISLLAIVFAGIFLSSNTDLNSLVSGVNSATSSTDASNVSSTSITDCPFDTSAPPRHGPIIMNEIAWMGNASSSNDEWIELANISTNTAEMGGWELVNQSEKIKVVFRSGAIIPAGGFYLLERGSNDFLQGIKADTFFQGSLKNGGDSFRLFDKGCELVDEVAASSGWPAGDNATKKTMERDQKTFAWHTSKIIGGTPRAENSIENKQTGMSTASISKNNQSSDPQSFAAASSPIFPLSKSSVDHILISQVQITGGAGKTDDDFIELYNPTGWKMNLKGYRLVKWATNSIGDTLIKSWTTDAFIPAGGYYLWANSDYSDIGAAPDSTTSATLSDDDEIILRYGGSDTGAIIDSVAWGKAKNLLRKSWQNGACRPASLDVTIGNGCDTGNNADDFVLDQVSEPRNATVVPHP